MQSGQGGIRYNDSVKQIQLMDENKNWVKWKAYDAYAEFEPIAYYATNQSNITYEFQKNGIYLFIATAYQGGTSGVTTTQSSIQLLLGNSVNTSSGLFAIKTTPGGTINFSISMGGYKGAGAIYYIGDFNNISVVNSYSVGNNDTRIISVEDAYNSVLIASTCGQSANCSGTCTTTDFKTYPQSACCCLTRERGSASIRAQGGSSGSISIAAELMVS